MALVGLQSSRFVQLLHALPLQLDCGCDSWSMLCNEVVGARPWPRQLLQTWHGATNLSNTRGLLNKSSKFLKTTATQLFFASFLKYCRIPNRPLRPVQRFRVSDWIEEARLTPIRLIRLIRPSHIIETMNVTMLRKLSWTFGFQLLKDSRCDVKVQEGYQQVAELASSLDGSGLMRTLRRAPAARPRKRRQIETIGKHVALNDFKR